MKFRSDEISGLLQNPGDQVGNLIRSLSPQTPIILCQGYGVDDSVPLRILAYVVPVLRLARQLPKHTTIELYWATKGVLRANPERDAHKLEQSGRLARELIASYIESFHSNLYPQVRFLEDADASAHTERAVSGLLPTARLIANDIPSIGSFAEKRGGERALRYMVEHALYMRDPLIVDGGPLPLLVSGMEQPVRKHLIMIGGPSERVFWKLRQELLNRLQAHTDWQSHQFFTKVGETPPYMVRDDEYWGDFRATQEPPIVDLLWGNLSGWPQVDSRVLLKDASGLDVQAVPWDDKNMGMSRELELAQKLWRKGFDNLMRWLDWARISRRGRKLLGAP